MADDLWFRAVRCYDCETAASLAKIRSIATAPLSSTGRSWKR
jgi:hypothetical protein